MLYGEGVPILFPSHGLFGLVRGTWLSDGNRIFATFLRREREEKRLKKIFIIYNKLKMVNKYKNGKIYTIRYKNDNRLIYVGSTVQPLYKRFCTHKSDSRDPKKENYLLYQKFSETDINDWYIELYEDCPCERREQLMQREGQVIREIGTLNKRIEGRTDKEWREDNKTHIKEYKKEYQETNKEKIKEYNETNKGKKKEYNKQYKEANKEKINEYARQYYYKKLAKTLEQTI